MIDFSNLSADLKVSRLAPWQAALVSAAHTAVSQKNGNLTRWLSVLENLPSVLGVTPDLDSNEVGARAKSQLDQTQLKYLENLFKGLHPWRKGPYRICDIHIDTEWRSDWKWDRLVGHISPLKGRTILDVGCGNGYHMWRMRGEGARLVIGVDPNLLFLVQFRAIKHFIGSQSVHMLPIGVEDLPPDMAAFDTVFSMGVLYHRRSPIDHLLQLRSYLRSGGELVLETLIVDGELHEAFLPQDRYAQMRNVWFLPSVETLKHWLTRCGFHDIEVVDVTQTSVEEQRSTEWMTFDSLPDFLDPNNPDLTIEGYPAPTRAILIAKKN